MKDDKYNNLLFAIIMFGVIGLVTYLLALI